MLRHFSSFRHLMYRYLFDQATRSGRCVEAFCGLLALLSVVVIFIESSIGKDSSLSLDEWYVFIGVELFFTLMFTIEYILRVISWPKPARYIFSFWGFIDLATTLPLYVLWLWPEFSVHYYFAWRSMRAIRVLRILKLLRYMPALQSLKQSIVNASHQLILFFSFIVVVMVASGALMFGVEGHTHGFTSLGASVYWAIVTVTTVGYGDKFPVTPEGRTMAQPLRIPQPMS